jgi:hypothetical protein
MEPTTDVGGPPGSFYRMSLELLSQAYPEEQPDRLRERARASLEALNDRGIEVSYPVGEDELAVLADDFERAHGTWLSASLSRTNSVEIAAGSGMIGIRNGGDPEGPVLIFTLPEWQAFTRGIKQGDFDFDKEIGPTRKRTLLQLVPTAPDQRRLVENVERLIA